MTRKTQAGWVKTLVSSFEAKGFSRALLFDATGIPACVVDEQQAISQDQITQLWEAASEITGSPLFGLETGAELPVNALGSVSYPLMSCQTLGESFQLLVRYQHIIADALDLSINQRANITELVFNNIGDHSPPSHHAIDASMSGFLSFYSWLLKENLPLTSVNFIRAKSEQLEEYKAFFHCKVRLGQNNNSLWLLNETLEKSLPTADEKMSELHRGALMQLAKERLQGDFRRTVADLIRQNMTQENFSLEFVASRLFMSKSGLQRRLKDEQINFQQILDETREYLAIGWLRQTPMSVAQIAEQLGFASASGFTRTFKNWTGKTPKDYRK